MPTSRSSLSSQDSEHHNHRSGGITQAMSKRWTTLETLGRCMFLFSVAFFIVGVLITVFGFSNTGIKPTHQIPLQILGPACLAMTVVMWFIGCVFSRIWNLEWKRQQQALELRDRVQLHALAMDILNNPVISPAMLQDPRLRRQLLLKLRAQRAFELSSNDGDSRRTSRATSNASRRQSSVQYDKVAQHSDVGSILSGRKSVSGGGATGGAGGSGDDLLKHPANNNGRDVPGILLSRFETLDFGSDGRASICSRGSKRYIVIHSDVPSDFSRLSCPSDYSIGACSRSSRSRSSRASSGVSSRLWDFSPRDSEWDADISLGSRESQMSVLKQDWAGGPSPGEDAEYTLSPNAPRKLSVVTFDIGSPNFRRHSSPAQMRRKMSDAAGGACECTCGAKASAGGGHNTQQGAEHSNGNNSNSKSSSNSHTSSHYHHRHSNGGEETCGSCAGAAAGPIGSGQSRASLLSAFRKRSMEQSLKSLTIEEDEPEIMEETTPLRTNEESNMSHQTHRSGTRQLRAPLRRNNTDDSEVERRVARLFKEIELSTTESVDESKIFSFSSEYDRRNVEVREVEIQTLTEEELAMLINNDNEVRTITINVPPVPPSGGKKNRSGQNIDDEEDDPDAHQRESSVLIDDVDNSPVGGNSDNNKTTAAKNKNRRSKFSLISSAFANFSASLGGKGDKKKVLPRRLVLQGVSQEDHQGAIKSPPPKYEDIMNKNIP